MEESTSGICNEELHNLYCSQNNIRVKNEGGRELWNIRSLTIKFANSPPCACLGSSRQKPQYGLMTLA
jgi:hypothetical protein